MEENNLQEITKDDITKKYNEIYTHNVAIWRKNKENKMVTIPMDKLKHYLGEDSEEEPKFYIETDWESRIKNDKPIAKPKAPGPSPMEEMEKYGKIEEQVKQFQSMSVVEREEVLDDGITKLSEQEDASGEFDINSITKMVDVVANTFYANNANLEDNISTSNVKNNLFGVLQKTNWIIQIIVNIFEENKYPYNDYQIIDKISTGSYTFDHINKVLLGFITFCIFYNEYIDNGLITKNIRVDFKKKYVMHYKKKFKDEAISLETIFMNGIRRISQAELLEYSVGALMYDIGKLQNILYHDSSEEFSEKIVKKHVLDGYNMMTQAHDYPFTALAMVAFHHEYYGEGKSYNFMKPLLSRFSGKKIQDHKAQYFITFDQKDFKNGSALAFFPCKVIEIIDIYDALVSRKKHSPKDALSIMKKDFILKNLQIDPVLFRIFLEFKVRCGLLEPYDFEEIDK